jgi:hypothetical protein
MNKEFWVSAIIRAIRTMAQTAVATIGTAAVLSEVDWMFVLSASVLAGVLSILTAVATGLPEVDMGIEYDEDTDDIRDDIEWKEIEVGEEDDD